MREKGRKRKKLTQNKKEKGRKRTRVKKRNNEKVNFKSGFFFNV